MTTGHLIGALVKRQSEAVSMLVAKEAEQVSSGSKLESKHIAMKAISLNNDHLKGACFHFGNLGSYKRYRRELFGR